jgi:geranylgeranyl pyrophosphate synthase
VEAIGRSNAVPLALKEAQDYVEQALVQLASMPEGRERQALDELARYTVNRKL